VQRPERWEHEARHVAGVCVCGEGGRDLLFCQPHAPPDIAHARGWPSQALLLRLLRPRGVVRGRALSLVDSAGVFTQSRAVSVREPVRRDVSSHSAPEKTRRYRLPLCCRPSSATGTAITRSASCRPFALATPVASLSPRAAKGKSLGEPRLLRDAAPSSPAGRSVPPEHKRALTARLYCTGREVGPFAPGRLSRQKPTAVYAEMRISMR